MQQSRGETRPCFLLFEREVILMKYVILMGSPNHDGNTAALLKPFWEVNEELGIEQEMIWLYEKNIQPCTGCKSCQDVVGELGCVQKDDFEELYGKVLDCDLLILATPIYSWFCTPPMKAAMDRLIYGGSKYYGTSRQPSTLAGKRVMTFATCGYPPHKGTDLWGAALLRWCKHSEMEYLGMYHHRDTGKKEEFMNEQVDTDLRNYARALHKTLVREMGGKA